MKHLIRILSPFLLVCAGVFFPASFASGQSVVGHGRLSPHSRTLHPLTVNPPVWLEQKVSASDGVAGVKFGWSVAISGKTAVIGDKFATVDGHVWQGAAYVFTLSNGVWTEVQKLTAADGVKDERLGNSVAISGSVIVVGAPSASVDGNPGQGAVYVFTRANDGTWTQSAKLTANDGAAQDLFGVSVAVSGSTILVGSERAAIKDDKNVGAAYVFTSSEDSWTQTQKLIPNDAIAGDFFGASVALSGSTALVGATQENGAGPGVAYVFTNSRDTWSQTAKLSDANAAPGEIFGISVDLSGSTAVVGAPYAVINGTRGQGAAFVFSNSGGAWTQTQKLYDENASGGGRGVDSRRGGRRGPENYGWDVAISGSTILVGSFFSQSAFEYVQSGGTWVLAHKLTPSDAMQGQVFGPTVALGGAYALVGSQIDTVNGNVGQGAAYFYGRSDLALAISMPDTVNPGKQYSSQTIVTNSASVASPAVVATMAVPAAASFVSANATQGGCDEANNVVTCHFGSVSGNAGTATANVLFEVVGQVGETLHSTASILHASPSLTAGTVARIVANQPPAAQDGTLETDENTAASGVLEASDPDSETLTFSIVGDPAHGTVTLDDANSGAYSYTPDHGYRGSDSFTFKANDGQADSNTATVSITVNAKSNSSGGGGSFGLLALLGLLGLVFAGSGMRLRVAPEKHGRA